MDGESLAHRSRHPYSPRSKCLILHCLISLIGGGDNPDQEQEICSNTNNPIGHNTSTKLEILQHEDQPEQSDGITHWIEDRILLMIDQPFPLHHYQFEVEHVNQHEIGPYTEIVEYLDCLVAVKMPEDGEVEVGLVSHVDDAEIAGVVAEDASEEDDDEAQQVSGIES